MRLSLGCAVGSHGTHQSCEERSERAEENLEKRGGLGLGLQGWEEFGQSRRAFLSEGIV